MNVKQRLAQMKRMRAIVRSMRQRAKDGDAGRLALAEVALMEKELELLERVVAQVNLEARYRKGA